MIYMVGIYKITNRINEKCYIGKSIDIMDRWMRHRSRAFQENDNAYDSYFYRAIRSYGLENFSFEVIEECNICELDEKEKYYINLYDSYFKNNKGYNMTRGGDGGLKQDYSLVCSLWNDGLTISEIAKEINGSRNTVKNILKSCDAGYSEEEARRRGILKKCVPIERRSLTGELIDIWQSSQEVERKLKIDHSSVSDCCNYIIKQAGGYKWRYVERSETAALADLLDE
jgi:predicted DNA-binding protein YlxM (UPF0122 family)